MLKPRAVYAECRNLGVLIEPFAHSPAFVPSLICRPSLALKLIHAYVSGNSFNSRTIALASVRHGIVSHANISARLQLSAHPGP